MKHELTITHDERMLARGWGVTCECGFKAAAESEAEAQRILASHQAWEAQKTALREKGLLS